LHFWCLMVWIYIGVHEYIYIHTCSMYVCMYGGWRPRRHVEKGQGARKDDPQPSRGEEETEREKIDVPNSTPPFTQGKTPANGHPSLVANLLL